MADSTEKSRKKQKRIKSKAVRSTFLCKQSKPEKEGRMKMKMKGKGNGRDNDRRKRRGGGPQLNAEKLMATSLPFPFTSKEAYEGNMRMPIGPDFNPASALSALNRPEIVKKPGLIIKPIQYEEVDPHETHDQPKRIIQGAKPKQSSKEKSKKGKSANKPAPKTLGKKVKST